MRLFAALLLLALALPAAAQELGPDELVRKVTADVLEAIQKDKDLQKNLLQLKENQDWSDRRKSSNQMGDDDDWSDEDNEKQMADKVLNQLLEEDARRTSWDLGQPRSARVR